MNLKITSTYRISLCFAVMICGYFQSLPAIALVYATKLEAVKWTTDSSKFHCRIAHRVEGFGEAVFEREAGENTRFYLNSKMPRMKAGKASLSIKPPAWSSTSLSSQLALVTVKEGLTPVTTGRKTSERMLAELEKGMLLEIRRQPLYGDTDSIRVILSSIGFRQSYQEYLSCMAGLLPNNFKQVERSTLYYANDDEELSDQTKRRLDAVIRYALADSAVQSFYLDGHTDSEGIRNENLVKSQRRTEAVMNYLIENQIPREQIITRWHGERYPVASNRSAKGRSQNRRVTLRLSKEPPANPRTVSNCRNTIIVSV